MNKAKIRLVTKLAYTYKSRFDRLLIKVPKKDRQVNMWIGNKYAAVKHAHDLYCRSWNLMLDVKRGMK